MEITEIKRIFYLVTVVLFIGTFLLVLTNTNTPTAKVIVQSPEEKVFDTEDYRVISCVDDLKGNVKVGLKDIDAGFTKFVTLDKVEGTENIFYRCNGLKVLRYTT